MSKKKRPPKTELPRETIDSVVLLLVTLQSTSAVRAACTGKLGLSETQAAAAIRFARAEIARAATVDKDAALGQAITRLHSIYEKSLALNDLKTALATQRELNRIQNLSGPTRKPADEDDAPGGLAAILAGRNGKTK